MNAMPRIARIVVPGLPHHITQRGNNRQPVFFKPDDHAAYLDFLRDEADRHGLQLLAYCLMPNHVHLVAVPPSDQALARAVGRTHWLYTRYANSRHRRSGHLWQNRFYSCPLDQPHTHHACVYVERNPVRAKLVRLAWNYPWSSAAAHVADAPPHPALDIPAWKSLCATRRWRNELQRPQDEKLIVALQTQTRLGRPLASGSFLSRLEHRLKRRLRPRPVGRPRNPKPLRPRKKK